MPEPRMLVSSLQISTSRGYRPCGRGDLRPACFKLVAAERLAESGIEITHYTRKTGLEYDLRGRQAPAVERIRGFTSESGTSTGLRHTNSELHATDH